MTVAPQELLEIHALASRVERRIERAFIRSAVRMQERMSIYEMGLAIGNGNVKAALLLVPDEFILEALSPVTTILRDAELKGGKIGAREVNRALKGDVAPRQSTGPDHEVIKE